jgi:NAD-dependent deacetylase
MKLESLLTRWREGGGRLVVLTGAGVSAESGIPTFRGPDGYWTFGSKNYSAMDLATRAMFGRAPETVWCWYLSRFAACASAQPNAAHRAVAGLQARYGERVVLVTQNIDALHQRAGSPREWTFAIHGDARFVRCSRCAEGDLLPVPAFSPDEARSGLSPRLRDALKCASCAQWLRPHVLWFDECYDEQYYRADSALQAAAAAELLVVVGTTGATTLPAVIGTHCRDRGVPAIDVNIEPNFFSEIAGTNGVVVRQPATAALPRIAELLGVEG